MHVSYPNAILAGNRANSRKQRMFLNGLVILAGLALDVHGHEAGRESQNDIRNPVQAPSQVPAKRVSDSGSNITAFVNELGPQLSSEASITLIGSGEFDELTLRWTAWEAPSFKAAVQVYTEEDVSNTVILSTIQTKCEYHFAHRQFQIKASNEFGLPWLAVSGRHGGIQSLGKLDAGVQINLEHLDSLVIGPDGKSATIGGGITSGAVTSALWDSGKWTSSCLLKPYGVPY